MAEHSFHEGKWKRQVWCDHELSLADKGMALGLLTHADNKTGYLYATYERMAADSGHSPRTFTDRMASLIGRDHVVKKGSKTWCVLRQDPQNPAGQHAESCGCEECRILRGGTQNPAGGYAESCVQNSSIELRNITPHSESSDLSSWNSTAREISHLLTGYTRPDLGLDSDLCHRLAELGSRRAVMTAICNVLAKYERTGKDALFEMVRDRAPKHEAGGAVAVGRNKYDEVGHG